MNPKINKNKMNKIIFTSLLLAGMSAMAQEKLPVNKQDLGKVDESKSITMQHRPSANKTNDVISNWYYPLDFIQNSAPNGAFKTYFSYLFPDSNVLVVAADGKTSYVGTHSVGFVFDPKDENIINAQNSETTILTNYNTWTLDSLYMPFSYVRYMDSMDLGGGIKQKVVDSLILNVYKMPAMTKGGFTPPNTEKFARPTFDVATANGLGAIWTKSIALTDADSTPVPSGTGWAIRGQMIEEINLTLNKVNKVTASADNIVGFTITFKPGYAYALDDTLESFSTKPVKAINYFGFRMMLNEAAVGDQVAQEKYFNNMLLVPKWTRYGKATPNSWDGYLPGNAFNSHYYLDCQFKVTCSNVGIDQPTVQLIDEAYPNPVAAGSNVRIPFEMKNSSNATVTVSNALGQVVKSIPATRYNAGKNFVDMTMDVAPGIYTYSITQGDNNVSKRFVVSQ